MPNQQLTLHGFLSRVLLGGACGCVALLVADLFFILPVWQPIPKGDDRWETVFLIAKFWLPLAFLLGAIAGLVWRKLKTFRLGAVGLAGCCLAVSLISSRVRPVMCVWPPDERYFLYKVAPRTIVAFLCLGALVISMCRGRGNVPRVIVRVIPYWLTIALVFGALKAGGAKWPPETDGPLYEVVPDTMASLFLIGALVFGMSGAVRQVLLLPSLQSLQEASSASVSETDVDKKEHPETA